MSKYNFVFPLKEWEGMPNPFKVEDPIPDEYDSDESIEIYVNRVKELKRLYDEAHSLEYLYELDLITWDPDPSLLGFELLTLLGFELLTKEQWELCTGRKQQ